ncbi:stage II sporulation protein P [Niallia circulans]|jgi:stage II sporulation protein P|uniref:stage II sporulation protein P n=1 Tax=Niallia circulans TaxID=1397 RepID=UPI000F447F4E|nr:stage II sporulation protein P [Niallia circulans]AYV66309.1 stage II sporulation protein P [Niallia circulans]AYV70876.1 stage II sporulation protein P [Niallia circulans]UQZ73251.1 stage II sporulation protein P [Niallia circulans]
MKISKSHSLIYYINISIMGIIVMFVCIAVTTTSVFSLKLTSNNMMDLLKPVNSTELFSGFFHISNHSFPPSNASEHTVSTLFLQLSANVRLDDIRTLLGRELPTLANFHTEIVVAEEGTTLANLPFESTPSKDMLENPLVVDEEKVKEEEQKEQPNKDENKKVAGKPKNKTIFIYNSHNYEAYRPLLKDTANNPNVISADERANVVGVSAKLTKLLEQEGIGVELDKTNINQLILDRKWNYTYSYTVSKEVVETALSNNNKLGYLIDIHRDAAGKKHTTASINDKRYAKLYFVIGKEHKNYEENQKFAVKIHKELTRKYPGISRGVFLKGADTGNGVYNQNFSKRALLLEVGGVDNNNEEINRSIEAFAEIYSRLYWEENKATQQ